MLAVFNKNRVLYKFLVIQAMSATSESVIDFFKAVDEGDLEKVSEMLNAKQVDTETKNVDALNATALDRAAYWGYEKLVHLLVDTYKANVNAINDFDKTPLQTAVDNYHAKIVRYLIKKNSERAEYAYKILNADKKVEELVEAAEENDIAKVCDLIESKSVDVNVTDKSNYNGTILHIAAKNGYEELARILVDKYKADMTVTDDIGDRPVDTAFVNLNSAVGDFLVERENANSV